MRTILIPLDGSTFAERSLPLATSVGRLTGARLELAAVHEPGWMRFAAGGSHALPAPLDAESRAQLGAYLDRTRAALAAAEPTLGIGAALLDGPVAETLIRHADGLQADLIILSTHGKVGPSRAWLGSVADELARTSGRPILAVPPGEGAGGQPASRIARIMVALDGTPESEGALGAAMAIAAPAGAEVMLLRVVQPLPPLLRAVATDQAYEEDLAAQRTEADAYVARVAERLTAQGMRACTEVRVAESPAGAITDCASDWNADVIALATHGRGRVGRMLLGSVADKVLRSARMPVLLHRPTPARPEEDLLRGAPRREGEAAVDSSTVGVTQAAAGGASVSLPNVAFHRVLVATDFAAPSLHAATWAARYLAADAELVLLHAIPLPRPPAMVSQSVAAREEMVETTRRGADARLREISLGLGAARIWPDVRVGVPADQIVTAATEYGAELIVVGEHGEHRGLSRLLGSTVEQVIRGARVPVLLARNLADAPPRRILVALDDSPAAPYLITWTRYLATRFSAEVAAVHVLSAPTSGVIPLGTAVIDPQGMVEQLRARAVRWMEEQLVPLRSAVGALTTAVVFGDPGPEILNIANRLAADLIVMGRGAAGRPLAAATGSVAAQVLRSGIGPALIVAAPPNPSAAS